MMFLAVVHGEGVKGGWYWPEFIEADSEAEVREDMALRMAFLRDKDDFRGSGTIGLVMPVPARAPAIPVGIVPASPIGSAAIAVELQSGSPSPEA